jgi:endoribonuclease LACTB2
VSACLLTHWHGDHIRGVPDLLSLCPDASVHKFPGGPELDFPDTDTKSTSTSQEQHPTGRPVPFTTPIRDGEVFSTTGATLRAIHSPGHTVDHCGFVLEEEAGALFSGDAVLGHGTAVFEDLAAYVRSLSTLKDACGETARIYPAHGAVVDKGRLKLQEYMDHRRQREDEVLKVVGEEDGVTSMEIVKVVYKNYPEALHAPAEGGTRLVLRKMEGEGKVAVDGEGRWRVKHGAAL